MKRQIKNEIYGQLAIFGKALSNPKRIEIIDLLCQGEKTVEAIAEQANLGIKNASAQLKELKASRLVDSRKEGRYVFHRLTDPSVASFWIRLRTFGHDRIGEIQRIADEAFKSPKALEKMSRKTLMNKAKRGEILLIDVRPADEYEAGHLPYAISVPPGEIGKHLKSFPKNKEIVAYCRGPYCFFAKEAVELLRKRGHEAFNLTDSVADWADHGLPVVRAVEG